MTRETTIRSAYVWIAILVPVVCAGCAAGPLGPPPGLGPGFDQLVGLFVLVVIGLVYLLFSRSESPWLRLHRDHSRRGAAEIILRERYAKGEIGRDEYLEKLNDLEKNDPGKGIA